MRTREALTNFIQALLTGILLQSAAGLAVAASIESLVMPGPVINGHAEFEEECSSCHNLFDRSTQNKLCLDCHEPVSLDLAAGTGFHGRDSSANSADCKQCHTEHQGREADIKGLRADLFDHSLTDFPLLGSHESQSCVACHEPDSRHAEAPSECIGCHEPADVHKDSLSSDCASCHETDQWQSAQFDHNTTEFTLAGAHAGATCLACHEDRRFESPGTECSGCHQLEDVHLGANGGSCSDCHGVDTWDSRFDHQQETGFALLGAHSLLSCRNCHVDGTGYEGLNNSGCNSCHNGDDIHLGRNGIECDSCHDQDSWTTSFDHLSETGFRLQSAHDSLVCSACHSDGLDVPLAVTCIGCHESADPHAGTLDECGTCHGQSNWFDDQRFQHDLAEFALVGLHRVVACEQCHESLVYSPLAQTCTDCHASDDVHDRAMGTECESCHNPSGWSYWLFDHENLTGFELTGAHEILLCADCHPPSRPAAKQSPACAACHRSDDPHKGGFGQNCNRCHLTDSFGVLKDDF